jgi:O-antigen/teichoic acid export membrane protein
VSAEEWPAETWWSGARHATRPRRSTSRSVLQPAPGSVTLPAPHPAPDRAGEAASDRGGLLQVVGRLGWGVADQAVSSLSNFALSLYVARALGASGFGAFSLAFITYSVVLNAARGIATDPMLVRHSGADRPLWRQATARASGTSLVVGTAAGAVSALAGLLLPGPVGQAFLALGLGLPGLMLQDSWRFAFFALGRPAAALVNDLVWTLLLVGTLVVLSGSGGTGVFGCLLAFGLTAAIAAVVGLAQARVRPRPAGCVGWVREHRQLSGRYLVENVSASGAAQIRSYVLGAVAGLASVGYVRASEILMGPFLVVLMGISQVAVPEASRAFHRRPGALPRFCLALGGVQAAGALIWGLAVLLALPHGLGQLLLAELWRPTSALLVPIMLTVMGACFYTAAAAGVRAMGYARRSLRAQLIASLAYVIGGSCGAVLAGAPGASWGVTAANTVGAMVWWYQLRAALAEHRQHAEVTA